jgi:hypothetical protein
MGLPALIKWENYIKQFPKLEEAWNMVPEPAKTLFQIQINVYGQTFWDIINEEEKIRCFLCNKEVAIICDSCHSSECIKANCQN